MAGEIISNELVDLTVAELRFQTAFYLEAVQAMMDGVTLGAEQVQDKRIEALEAGPNMDASTAILMFALTLVLEGPVGPAIAATMIRHTLAPMMKASSMAILRMQKVPSDWKQINLFRQKAFVLGEKAIKRGIPLTGKERGDLIKLAKDLRTEADNLQQDLRGKVKATKPLRDALNSISSLAEQNLVPGVKAFLAAKPDVSGSMISPPLQTQGSPGVQVTAAAMAAASKLRLAIIATHEALEAEIKHPDMTLFKLSSVLNDYRLDGFVELGTIRDNIQLATEAMIWAALLLDNIQKDIMRNRKEITAGLSTQRDFVYSQQEHKPMKIRADNNLKKYLLVRFAAEVERWARETNAWTGSLRGGFQRPTWGAEQSDEEREDLLVAYLAAVADGAPATELNLHI